MKKPKKQTIVIVIAVVAIAALWLRVVTGPSPSVVWRDELSDEGIEICAHQIVFGTEQGIPLIAIMARYPNGNNPFEGRAIRLAVNEFPHAAYINDQMIRAERDEFVLYANDSDKRFVRIPVDPVAAAHQFGPGDKTRDSMLEFWDKHVAPKMK